MPHFGTRQPKLFFFFFFAPHLENTSPKYCDAFFNATHHAMCFLDWSSLGFSLHRRVPQWVHRQAILWVPGKSKILQHSAKNQKN